ncbi:Os03g0619501 [Oryza sativa Japonica Group]|uniref:Os03g0619501 protein n=1 Tax=Oryza sativa subsp. japonica TaxID=39947 RepID=A0A0P0W111_ORYSJ|nr:hypothetical protein EE612_018960 [Oryza sativa]BAS85296.1 Os03g0619501 [Oryza sativa Japonica Group]
MLNCKYASISKKFFREVIDQLPIDKAVNSMTNDFLNFLSHFLLFGSFNFCDLSHRIHSDTCPIYLYFVCVHSCVCN